MLVSLLVNCAHDAGPEAGALVDEGFISYFVKTTASMPWTVPRPPLLQLLAYVIQGGLKSHCRASVCTQQQLLFTNG